MDLTHDEVLEILRLVEGSHFDELQLQTEKLALTVRRSAGGGQAAELRPLAALPVAASPPAPAAKPAADGSGAAGRDGLAAVTAPMLGTFYRSSEPGAPPYVDVGSDVTEESTVGLIEVMKLFTAVKAGRRGRIQEILAENGQLVEQGAPLCLIDTRAAPAEA